MGNDGELTKGGAKVGGFGFLWMRSLTLWRRSSGAFPDVFPKRRMIETILASSEWMWS